MGSGWSCNRRYINCQWFHHMDRVTGKAMSNGPNAEMKMSAGSLVEPTVLDDTVPRSIRLAGQRFLRLSALLSLCIPGLGCSDLLGPSDAPIQVEYRTDRLIYAMDAEVVATLKNVGRRPIGIDNHRSAQQWEGNEWGVGVFIHDSTKAVIMEPTFELLRPGESLTDTIPVRQLWSEFGGEYRLVRLVISAQNKRGVLSETNSFSIQEP